MCLSSLHRVDAAMNVLLAHSDDPSWDLPLPTSTVQAVTTPPLHASSPLTTGHAAIPTYTLKAFVVHKGIHDMNKEGDVTPPLTLSLSPLY